MNKEPYQSASEAMIRSSQIPKNILKGVGTTLASSAAILPFLSSYIPQNLAIKGLSKINPRLGQFAQTALNSGESIDDVKEYIKGKVTPSEEEQNALQSGNIIEQYSPELHEFISSEIEKGRSPIEAGALAELNGKFKNAIGKLTKDHKSPFSTLLQTVYGSGQQQSKAALQQEPNQMGQPQQEGNPQAKQQLLQAMQTLSQKLRT